MNILRRLARAGLDVFFPRVCRVCGCSLGEDEELMCPSCLARLPRTDLDKVEFNTLHHRIGGDNEIDIAAGWFYYYRDSDYARLIHEAKYGDRPMTAWRLGAMYGEELTADGFAGRWDVMLPVPLHRDKRLRRGYNQSEEIARGMASRLGCDVGDNLVAVRRHSTQTHRSGVERYRNVKGCFGLRHGDELDGLSVAIVDDIITTGSTILDCINAMCEGARPASISVLTLGVTHLR